MKQKYICRLLALSGMALALAGCAPGELDEDGNPLPPDPTAEAPPPPAEEGPLASQTCGMENFAAQILAQVNQMRASAQVCGAQGARPAVAALGWNAKLEAAAARHSQDMAAHTYMSHTGSDGSTHATRATDAGYSFQYINENVAVGYPDISAVVAGWMGSDGHCANIMAAQIAHTAAACTIGSDGRKYWTLMGGSGQ